MTDFKDITTRIRREMNGAVSGSMRSLSPSCQRKINFGVSIPTIRDICSDYCRNHKLAVQLREHNVREWWLAAAFVDNPECISKEEADNISEKWLNIEESDIYAYYLLFSIKDAIKVAETWLRDESALRKNAAEKIILRLAPDLSDDEAMRILDITSSEIPLTAIYKHHKPLRTYIRSKGPYSFSWILDEYDY